MALRRILTTVLVTGGLVMSLSCGAQAQSMWQQSFEHELDLGRTTEAAAITAGVLEAAPGDRSARFASGLTQFLAAVGGFGQAMHRYGLQSDYSNWLLGSMPFLRLPVLDNADPQLVSYVKLRQSLADLATGMEAAEQELARVEPGALTLTLDVGQIKVDFSGTGAPDSAISLWRLISVVATRDDRMDRSLLVDLDESDVLWLRAYCHLIAAMADFMLGYDWEEGYQAVFPDIFPVGEDFRPSIIADNTREMRKQLAALEYAPSPPPGLNQYFDQQAYAEWEKTEDGQKYLAYRTMADRLQYGGVADLVAYIHLAHWPVADAGRLEAALHHLEGMVSLSRANWQSVQAETDHGREWIPNAGQTGGLPGMRVGPAEIHGWSDMLDQFDGILAGRILIPHWRFDEGINFRRMLLEPTAFDPVLLLQGSAAEPYLEAGTKADGVAWGNIMVLFGGNFLSYFFYIN